MSAHLSNSTTTLLNLPAEIRCQFYSYLISNTIELDFCSLLAKLSDNDEREGRKPSPLLRYLREQEEIAAFTRSFGLHVLAVHSQLAGEIFPLYRNTIIKPHCSQCLDKWLHHLTQELGLHFENYVLPVIQHLHYMLPTPQVASRFEQLQLILRWVNPFRQVLSKYYVGWRGLLDHYSELHRQKWRLEGRLFVEKSVNGQQERVCRKTVLENINLIHGIPENKLLSMANVRLIDYQRNASDEWWIIADLDWMPGLKQAAPPRSQNRAIEEISKRA